MEQPLDNLIYDRTQADIYRRTAKGYYNAEDLNRIEEWTLFLKEKLAEYGYHAEYAPPKRALTVNFPYTGKVEKYVIPEDSTYTFTVYGAGGSYGPRYSFFDPNIGGKGAKMTYTTNLTAGTKLQILTGGQGLLLDGGFSPRIIDENGIIQRETGLYASGCGGGMSAVFREIPEIIDDLYQFEKNGTFLEAMIVAGGGGGGGAKNGATIVYPGNNGIGKMYYYPGRYDRKYSKYAPISYDPDTTLTWSTANPNLVLGIQQFIDYDGRSPFFKWNTLALAGFGGGNCGIGNGGAPGGGWRRSGMGEAISWCRENAAIGVDGVRTGNGLVSIKNNAVWKREDFPTKPEVDRIRRNICCLKDGFFSIPTWRDFAATVDFVDIEQANAMEWDLEQIYLWLRTMANSFQFREAGTIFMEAGGIFNR